MENGRNFAWPVTAINKYDYMLLNDFTSNHKELLSNRRIIIFGAGIRGTEISVMLKGFGYDNILFVDNNNEKWGGYIDEYKIMSPDSMLSLKEDKVILISTEESAAIEEQLKSYGLIENEDFFCLHNHQYDIFVNEFNSNKDYSALIMGDCMFEMLAFDDQERISLAELITDKLGEENVKLLTVHGMNMVAFYHILKAQCQYVKKPEVFVVMINFETLTDKQHLLPRSQHSKLMELINESIGKKSAEFNDYTELTKQRVENLYAEFFTTNKFTTNAQGNIGVNASKLFLKLNYLYKLNTNIEPVQCLIKIMEFCNDQNIRLIPFVPPVNYQLGIELFGDKFEESYGYNLNLLKAIINEHGFELLDLSHIITREYFSHSSTPDETVNYKGKLIVADEIVNKINEKRKK